MSLPCRVVFAAGRRSIAVCTRRRLWCSRVLSFGAAISSPQRGVSRAVRMLVADFPVACRTRACTLCLIRHFILTTRTVS